MNALVLHELHERQGARFTEVNGSEVVAHYGEAMAEHAALCNAAGVLDLSFRSRLCLAGADRQKFLNGQVTNNVKDLRVGEGCYAALITAKGRMQSDLDIYCLSDEMLLDFEPGLSAAVAQRLEKYVIADDVQVVDVASDFGLLSVQGPKAKEVVKQLEPSIELSADAMSFVSRQDEGFGEFYVINLARTGSAGFDLFVPNAALSAAAEKLNAAAIAVGGSPCGWQALETARIEAGIPRYGQDMDETTLAPEAGIEARAISYAKGCYIGQEVIARIRTYGQVAKALRGLRLADDIRTLPVKGDKLFKDEKEVGYVTSAAASPAFKANIALGYVRRECNRVGESLRLRSAEGESPVEIVSLPFRHS